MFYASPLAFLIDIEYVVMIMEPQPHMRKIEVSLSDAEEITLKSLKRMHPEWVRKNGDCPECVSLQHQMSDTTRPESVAAAMADSYPELDS